MCLTLQNLLEVSLGLGLDVETLVSSAGATNSLH